MQWEEESHTIVSSKDLKDPMLAPTIKVDDVVEINYKEKGDTVAYKGSVIALGKLHISMTKILTVCMCVCVCMRLCMCENMRVCVCVCECKTWSSSQGVTACTL